MVVAASAAAEVAAAVAAAVAVAAVICHQIDVVGDNGGAAVAVAMVLHAAVPRRTVRSACEWFFFSFLFVKFFSS
jgi:hypothetical protein